MTIYDDILGYFGWTNEQIHNFWEAWKNARAQSDADFVLIAPLKADRKAKGIVLHQALIAQPPVISDITAALDDYLIALDAETDAKDTALMSERAVQEKIEDPIIPTLIAASLFVKKAGEDGQDPVYP